MCMHLYCDVCIDAELLCVNVDDVVDVIVVVVTAAARRSRRTGGLLGLSGQSVAAVVAAHAHLVRHRHVGVQVGVAGAGIPVGEGCGDESLHVDLLHGLNAHHVAEAAFKALARALREAVEPDPRMAGVLPSTKGAL